MTGELPLLQFRYLMRMKAQRDKWHDNNKNNKIEQEAIIFFWGKEAIIFKSQRTDPMIIDKQANGYY